MNDYKVGSVADLISQGKCITLISNKKKHKTNEQKPLERKLGVKNIDGSVIKGRKSKQKGKNTLKEVFQKIDKPVTNLDDVNVENKNIVSKKKRKNPEGVTLESKNVSNKKIKKSVECEKHSRKEFQKGDEKSKIDIDLNFVPSDSEEDENKSVDKTTNAKPQISNQKRKYKNFTECTVFVGNIPINYDKKKVCKIFSKFGSIQSARIRCIPVADINMSKKVAAIKKQFNTKRNSLVAYVQYETQDSANAALKANGMMVDGHHLRVDLAEGSKENDNNKAVFVGGLPFDVEDDELWEFFQSCGKINSVRVVRDSQTSMGKGFGYVNFDSTAAVELALQLNGQDFKKRTINVKRCVKARNKNKLNAFGRKKSKEVTDQLLCKRGRKFKEEKKKMKSNKSLQFLGNFQGRQASVKEKKKKKKLSQAALRQRKLVKILTASKN